MRTEKGSRVMEWHTVSWPCVVTDSQDSVSQIRPLLELETCEDGCCRAGISMLRHLAVTF